MYCASNPYLYGCVQSVQLTFYLKRDRTFTNCELSQINSLDQQCAIDFEAVLLNDLNHIQG